MNRVIENVGLSCLLFFSKKAPRAEKYDSKRLLVDELLNNSKLIDELKHDIYIEDGAIKKLIELDDYDKKSDEYKKLYDNIIQVGEYKNL